jgi:hypothetical protein
MKRLLQRLKIAQKYRAKIRKTMRARAEYERATKIMRARIMEAETLTAKAKAIILVHESRNNALIRLAGAQNAELHNVERIQEQVLRLH